MADKALYAVTRPISKLNIAGNPAPHVKMKMNRHKRKTQEIGPGPGVFLLWLQRVYCLERGTTHRQLQAFVVQLDSPESPLREVLDQVDHTGSGGASVHINRYLASTCLGSPKEDGKDALHS